MKTTDSQLQVNLDLNQIQQWFSSRLGQQLLAAEKAAMAPLVESVFGYHCLQVGMIPDAVFYETSSASHKFMMLPDGSDLPKDESLVVGNGSELPFASECIDAVILHHALDFSDKPHQVLREASRVLRPGGKLLLIGFNPASLWGCYRMMAKRRKPVPWGGWFIRQRRLHDWLTLLELKEEQHEGGFYRPPLSSERWMKRLGWLEKLGGKYLAHSGGFYIYLATKETFSVTPIGMDWRHRLVMPLIPKPAQQAGRASSAKSKVQRVNEAAKPGQLYFFPGVHRPHGLD